MTVILWRAFLVLLLMRQSLVAWVNTILGAHYCKGAVDKILTGTWACEREDLRPTKFRVLHFNHTYLATAAQLRRWTRVGCCWMLNVFPPKRHFQNVIFGGHFLKIDRAQGSSILFLSKLGCYFCYYKTIPHSGSQLEALLWLLRSTTIVVQYLLY